MKLACVFLPCLLALLSWTMLANGARYDDSSEEDDVIACRVYSSLSPEQKLVITELFGEPCLEAGNDLQLEKRQTQFIRFGRTSGSEDGNAQNGFWEELSKPTFVRFGRSTKRAGRSYKSLRCKNCGKLNQPKRIKYIVYRPQYPPLPF